jgi:hypothetical protein
MHLVALQKVDKKNLLQGNYYREDLINIISEDKFNCIVPTHKEIAFNCTPHPA